jgi:predicted PurR-regulated permease PerM
MPNLQPAEWVAIAAVVVALIGNIASIVTTVMNNRARRGEQLYEERLKHINRVHSKLSKFMRSVLDTRLFMDSNHIDQYQASYRQLENDCRDALHDSIVFLPKRLHNMVGAFILLVGATRAVGSFALRRMNTSEDIKVEINDYEKHMREVVEKADELQDELYTLVNR